MGTHDVTHLRGDKSVGILKGWKEACAPGLGSDNPRLSLLGKGREEVIIDRWKGEEYTGCLSHKLTNFAKMRR